MDTSTDLPLITVITLCYRSQHIFETIDSVLEQSYPNIQYIICDDGTPDFSINQIQDYIVTRPHDNLVDLQILTQPENVGTVKNINTAISHVSGEYIIYLSADDLFMDSEVVSDWVTFFQKKQCKIATAYRAVYDEDLKYFHENLPTTEQAEIIKKGTPKELFEALTKYNFILGCTTVVTSSLFRKYGNYDETYQLIEDYPFNLRLLRENVSIDFMNRITVKYRAGGASSPINFNAKYQNDMHLIYQKEIAPYTERPFQAWLQYITWNLRQKNDKAFIQGYRLCQKYPLFLPVLALFHPVRGYRKIKRITGRK